MDKTEAGGDSEQLENTSVLFWDFFGYRARGTAAHFANHLADFLRRHSMHHDEMQLESEQPMHCAVRCTLASPSDALIVAQTLKASARSQLASLPRPTEPS
jgi:hypothetical protein